MSVKLTDRDPAKIRDMFAAIAPRYDFLNHFLSFGIDRHWRARTVRLTLTPTTRRVLDLCTGTGDLAMVYHRAMCRRGDVFSPATATGTAGDRTTDNVDGDYGGTGVIGTDFCEPMLEIGRRRIGSTPGLELQVADTLNLPFNEASFDLVSVAFGLRNVADTAAGLHEMVRVCRPGGQVAILEFTMPRSRLIGPVYRFFFLRILPRIGQLVARNAHAAYHYLPASVGAFPQYEAMLARMESAGLCKCRMTPMTFGIATLYVGVKR